MPRLHIAAVASLVGLLLAMPPVASGHTELVTSDPADGAVLTEPPAEVVLTFEGEIGDEAAFVVTGPSGDEAGTGELDLDVADRNEVRGDVVVEGPGDYVVAYTVAGEDGHEITGEVTFTYAPEGTMPPNTAASVPASTPMAVLGGIALIAAAALVLGRTRARR